MLHQGILPKERFTRAKALCRANGLALTVQRRGILEELLDRTDHPTADEIFSAVAARLPGLSRTTVYRVLETLVRLKIIRRVPHEGAVARYDPRTERHHHLECDRCGTLVDLPGAAAVPLDLSRLTGLGVQVSEYCIHFTGTCSRCRQAPGKRNRSAQTNTKERR